MLPSGDMGTTADMAGNSRADRASPLRGLTGWGTQDEANNADSPPVMTQQQSSDDNARAPIDGSRASRGGGSIGLVLLIALVLVGAAGALLLIGRARAEPYILALLAVLATLGVFLLFALAAGILRASGREAASPLLKALVDHANEGILVTDPDRRVVYANATLANWLDHDLAQVGSAGLKLDDIVAGEGAALLTTLAAVPGDVKTEVLDIDLKTRSGRTVPARLFHKVAFGADGAPGPSRTLVLNRARDGSIDPQRAAEVRFMRFFPNTPMAIATVDKQGRIADSNARFARLFNPVFIGEASGDRSILAVVAERDRGALEAAIRKAAEGQGEIAPVDAALAGAGECYASFFVTAIEDEKERDRDAAIVYALETTQQRTLENQGNQQQKMETIGRLAGNIAHDFNNLLGAIMMATDFLLNAHRPTDPSFQDIMHIKQNTNRAASLVRQLLAFSRKQTLRPQVIDLGEALSDLTVLLRRLIGENVTLDVPQVRDLWPVRADVGQFEQVIINLAVNARDAMPLGGKLTLRTSNVSVGDDVQQRHKDMPADDYVLVEVEDTGSGIAPEIIDKIFDPFYTTKDVGKGTGLGLSTVYGIVKQTDGFIYVESEGAKGTTFRIFLPRYVPGADDEVEVPQLP